MENDNVEMNIQVNSQVNNKGVDEAARGMANIATNAENAEKQVKELSSAITQAGSILSKLNKTIKPGMDLSEIEKALSSIEKRVDNAINNSINMYAQNVLKEISGQHKLRTGLFYDAQGLRNDRDKSVESHLNNMYSENAKQRYYQLSHLNRYTDWKENRRDTDSKWQQHLFNQSVQDRIEKGYKQKYTFDETSIKYAQKDLDLWGKRLNEEAGIALKRNLESSKKITDKMYQRGMSAKDYYYDTRSKERARQNYEEGEHLYRQNQWLTSQGKAPLTEVRGEDGSVRSAEEVMRYYLYIQEEMKQRAEFARQAKEAERQAAEALKQKEAETQRTAQATVEENQATQQSAEQTKKAVKEMTRYQSERIKLAQEQLELKRRAQEGEQNAVNVEQGLRSRELDIAQAEHDRKVKFAQDNAGYTAYRNAHPEQFSRRGGQYFNKNYQTANALAAIGSRASSLGTGGKMVGDLLDTMGAFLKSPIAGAATALKKLTTGIIDLAAASMKAFAEIESIKTQLGVVFSNQTQADAMFGQISQYAVHSPFGVQQTSELAVLLKQSGVYASDLMDTLRMLGDTAGGNMEKMKRIANNYAQIVSIGKASMLDMRQFAYAGIPIFEAVSKELGVSQKELRKMISEGKVTSDIIAKVFKDLTGINGIFENATEKGAKTLKARMQNLQDAKQLALSTYGERLVMGGSTYGNDSPILTLITDIENMFQWWKEHNDTKNIERDVSLIANNKDRIKELEEVLKMAEGTGDKELIKLVKQELEFQKNNWGYDKQRLVYSTSYDIKNAEADRYREKYGEYNEDYHKDISAKLVEAETKLFYSNPLIKGQLGTKYTYRSEEERAELQKQVEMYNLLNNELARYAQSLRTVNKTTEEEIKANKERNLINDQQAAFDKVNSMADSSTSLLSQFQELNEIYTASDEYKKKKEEENQKALKEALGYLKEIAKHTDEQGNVDITGWSAKEFNKWSGTTDGKAAMEAAKKLQVVNSDRRYSQEERALLVSQYGHFQTELEEYLGRFGNVFNDAYMYDLKRQNLKLKSNRTDTEFYNEFVDTYGKMNEYLENAYYTYSSKLDQRAKYDKSLTPEVLKQRKAEFKEEMNAFKNAFINSTNQYQTQNGAAEMSESALSKQGNEFIALWKRIFATNTGLSTQGMNNPRQTLDLYLNDVSQRKIVSNVMKATLDTMGVDAATSLLRASGRQTTLPDATSRFINQIDWKKSADGLREFATRLSASTDVISAYTQGLEEEYEVISNLIVQGAAEAESQDLEKQKLVTVKQLQKLSEAGMSEAASQLVNALGDKLKTAEGSSVSFKDGKFYDEKGLEVTQEQLRVTDDIFEYLKQLLPDIKQQIAESKLSGENNRLLSEQFKKVLPSMLTGMMMGGNYLQRGVDRILLDNPEYAVNQAYNAYDVVTGRYKNENGSYREGFEWLSNTNVEDLFRAGIDTGADNYEEANRLLEELISVVRTSAASLADPGSGYGNLQNFERSQEMREAARVAYRNAMGFKTEENYSATGWADKGGQSLGNKIVKDLLGVDVGYTKEQLFDAFKEDAGLDMSTQLDKTIEKQLLFKVAIEETKDAMQNLGDETANLVGTLGKKAFTIPFEKLGESAMNYWSQALSYEEASEKCAEDQKKAYRELGAEALNTLGPIMQKAGFEMVARGAINDSWGMILGGLGLAAAGGFASGLGNALSANNDKNKDEAAKIQDLKDQLADLLEQARKDALYYENNLRHKTALGINKEFSYQSVNDAVITPDGDVITTDPKDYLIATKTPGQFAGGGTVTPIINCNVINNSSSKVRQEQQQNPDGSIDIITIIEDTVGNYIASSKSDDAFSARNSRIRGRQAIMS